MSDEERKRRNYVIAGTVGGLLLPLAGAVGAMIFYARDDHQAAWALLAGSTAGVILYLIVFTVI